MQLKPGSRLRSAVCTTEVIVVKAPADGVNVECGGHPMLAPGETASDGLTMNPDMASGTQVGKRFADESGSLELLAMKAGTGSLSANGVALPLKDAKALPSSD